MFAYTIVFISITFWEYSANCVIRLRNFFPAVVLLDMEFVLDLPVCLEFFQFDNSLDNDRQLEHDCHEIPRSSEFSSNLYVSLAYVIAFIPSPIFSTSYILGNFQQQFEHLTVKSLSRWLVLVWNFKEFSGQTIVRYFN